MAGRHEDLDGLDPQLCEALAAYLEGAERRAPTDRAELLDRHPGLEQFVDTHEWLEQLTAPVRWLVQTSRRAAARRTAAGRGKGAVVPNEPAARDPAPAGRKRTPAARTTAAAAPSRPADEGAFAARNPAPGRQARGSPRPPGACGAKPRLRG
jgi:hypothetical protein